MSKLTETNDDLEFYFESGKQDKLHQTLILKTWKTIAHLFDNWHKVENTQDPIQIKFIILPTNDISDPFNQSFFASKDLQELQSIKDKVQESIKLTTDSFKINPKIEVNFIQDIYQSTFSCECVIELSKKDLKQAKLDVKKLIGICFGTLTPIAVLATFGFLATTILTLSPIVLASCMAPMLFLSAFLIYELSSLNTSKIETMPTNLQDIIKPPTIG